MLLAGGEIIMCRVVGVQSLGAQRGEHVHQLRPLGVDGYDPAPQVGDERVAFAHHVCGRVLGFAVVHLVEHRGQQSFLTAYVMQYPSLGKPDLGGYLLQRCPVVAECAEAFDRRIEDVASAIRFVIAHDAVSFTSPACVLNVTLRSVDWFSKDDWRVFVLSLIKYLPIGW